MPSFFQVHARELQREIPESVPKWTDSWIQTRLASVIWEKTNAGSSAAQAPSARVSCEIGTKMLWTILVVLFVLWLLGVVTSYTLGGFIHVLLLVALAIFLINMIQGRRRSA
jgi:hypothetical protein